MVPNVPGIRHSGQPKPKEKSMTGTKGKDRLVKGGMCVLISVEDFMANYT